jgi:hypothetical protein
LGKRIEKIIDQPSERQVLEHNCQLEGVYELSFTPLIQSGGNYDFD